MMASTSTSAHLPSANNNAFHQSERWLPIFNNRRSSRRLVNAERYWTASMSQTPSAWDDYRKRRTVLVVLLAGFLPAGIFVSFLSKALIGSGKLVVPFALCWMASYGVAGHRLAYFRCPRCVLPFFYCRWCFAPWTRQCLHCGWVKWREFDPSCDPPATSTDFDEYKLNCFHCGADMAADTGTCPVCGWSYHHQTSSNNPMNPSGGSGAS